jgi:putative transposase
MTYPLVQDLAADRIPVPVTCRILGFSKQAYYAWRASPVTRRDLETMNRPRNRSLNQPVN